MTGEGPSPLSRMLNGAVAVLFGTLLVGIVGTRITSYYTDARTAAEVKDDVGSQVMELTTTETEGLRVLIRDLAPHSFVLRRCLAARPADTSRGGGACADAAAQSILDEQQLAIDGRVAHNQGLLLQRRMDRRLTAGAEQYSALLRDLRALRRLNGSSVCDADRRRAEAEHLQGRYPEEVTDRTVDALVGRPTTAESCDDHGELFRAAASAVTRALVLRSEEVAARVDAASVEDLTDTRREMITALATDVILLALFGLGLVLAAWSVLVERRRVPTSPRQTGAAPTAA